MAGPSGRDTTLYLTPRRQEFQGNWVSSGAPLFPRGVSILPKGTTGVQVCLPCVRSSSVRNSGYRSSDHRAVSGWMNG